MDKIYSRPRIKIPKFQMFYNRNQNKRKKKLSFIIILILIVTLIGKLTLNYITPMFEEMCYLRAKLIAAQIVNKKTKESIENINYNDLITIVRDNNGNITMVKANVISINRISAELTIDIQEALENKEQALIKIHFGSIFGNQILSNFGPQIPIRINPAGVVTTDFRSEFIEAGINQTIHRIYLYTVCRVNIVTPIKTITNEITNEVMVAETVIVGPVPDSYYNLEGLGNSDILEVVN